MEKTKINNRDEEINEYEEGLSPLTTPEYESLAEVVQLGSQESDGSSVSTVSLSDISSEENELNDIRSTEDWRSCSMSLSSVVHAEELLQKQLPVVRGGSHVEFTKDDLVRIKDPSVLDFLERNSIIFGKYMKSGRAKSDQDPDKNRKPMTSTISAADVQKTIDEFQEEIDTFITAVDHAGKKYNIELNSKGTLQVPIIDDIGEDNHEEYSESQDVDASLNESHSVTISQHQINKSMDGISLASVEEELLFSKEGPLPATDAVRQAVRFVSPSPSHKEFVEHKSVQPLTSVVRSTRTENPIESPRLPSSLPMKKSTLAHPIKQKNKPVPPRININRFSLLPEEEIRVNDILSNDNVVAQWRENNPYILSESAQNRFSEIENSLSIFRSICGSPGDTINTTLTPSLRKISMNISAKERTKASLGNKYMEEVKEHVKMRRAMIAINEKLVKNQRELEEIKIDLNENLPKDIISLRPSWTQSTVKIASEEEINNMVKQAAIEEERSKKFQHNHFSMKQNDPYATLLQQVMDARVRAEHLLERNRAEPLEVTSFSAIQDEETTDFSEAKEVPENILSDLQNMI